MSATEADAILNEIRAAVAEDDMETVVSLLHRLDGIEPATATIVRTVLFIEPGAVTS